MQHPGFGSVAAWARPPAVLAAALTIAAAALSLAVAPGVTGAAGAALALLMGAVAAIDARHFIIPDGLSVAAFALALLSAGLCAGDMWLPALSAALLRAAVAAALFWAVRIGYRRLRGREGLGFGDVKLAGVAGAWLAPVALPFAVEIAALSAIAFYVLRQSSLDRRARADARLPFGAFFAPAIWLGWLLQTVTPGRF